MLALREDARVRVPEAAEARLFMFAPRAVIKASRPEGATCKGATKEHNGGCLQSTDPR